MLVGVFRNGAVRLLALARDNEFRLAATLLTVPLLLTLTAWVVVDTRANGHVVNSVSPTDSAEVVIVPGARVWSDGRPSVFLQDRIDAAAKVHQQRIATHILVSGDNRRSHNYEVEAMRNALLEVGVPASAITLDLAGFDTWDTCLRAHEQFGVAAALVVTQKRHAARTAALCSSAGIDVTVYAIDEPDEGFRNQLQGATRERLATVKALADILRKPDAHYGGDFVGLSGSVNLEETFASQPYGERSDN